MKNIVKFGVVVISMVLFSCSNPVGNLSDTTASGQGSGLPDSIIETEDAYIVDGDFRIAKDNPNALAAALYFSNSPSEYKNSRGAFFEEKYKWLESEQNDITYSFTGSMAIGSNSHTVIQNKIIQALNSYQNNVNLTFRQVASGGMISFDVIYDDGIERMRGYADASFKTGPSGSLCFDNVVILLNNFILRHDNLEGITSTIYHEIGHSLGLAHEGSSFNGNIMYGAYDVDSVMISGEARQPYPSYGDYASLKHLYNQHLLSYRVYSFGIGIMDWVNDCAAAGTTRENSKIEVFMVKLENLPGSIEYQVYMSGTGWMDWEQDGSPAGWPRRGKRMEAIKIRLNNVPGYSVRYKIYDSVRGWQNWKYNGSVAGQTDQSWQIEAIIVELVPDKIIIDNELQLDSGFKR